MSKVSRVTNKDGSTYGWMFRCPGCKSAYEYSVGLHCADHRWTFNGDEDKPTFTPSILSRSKVGDELKEHVCHIFVTDGKIQYLSDCTHSLAGQTIKVPDWDSEED